MILSLGNNCSIAYNLRKESNIFDWIKTNNFNNIANIINNEFNNFININNLIYVYDTEKHQLIDDKYDENKNNNILNVYKNIKYDLYYYHDFLSNNINCFLEFEIKYKRRIKRFYNIIMNNYEIIFIRNEINYIEKKYIQFFFETIKKINKNIIIKLYIIYHKYYYIDYNLDNVIIFYYKKIKTDTWKMESFDWQNLLLRSS